MSWHIRLKIYQQNLIDFSFCAQIQIPLILNKIQICEETSEKFEKLAPQFCFTHVRITVDLSMYSFIRFDVSFI